MTFGSCILCDKNAEYFDCAKCHLSWCCKNCIDTHQQSCHELCQFKYHFCYTHKNEHVKEFCLKCNDFVCDICLNGDHKAHSAVHLKKAFEKLKHETFQGKVETNKSDRLGDLGKMVCALEKLWIQHLSTAKDKMIQELTTAMDGFNQHVPEDEAYCQLAWSKDQGVYPLLFLRKYSSIHKQHVKQLRFFDFDSQQIVKDVALKLCNEPLSLGQIFKQILLKLDDETDTDESHRGDTADNHSASSLFSTDTGLLDEIKIQLPDIPLNEKEPRVETDANTDDVMHGDFVCLDYDSDIDNKRLCSNSSCVSLKTEKKYLERQLAEKLSEIKRYQQDSSIIETTSNDLLQFFQEIEKDNNETKCIKLKRTDEKDSNKFVRVMETILDIFVKTKNNLLTAQKDLEAKIKSVAKWTNEERISSETAMKELRNHIRGKETEIKDRENEIKDLRLKLEKVKPENDKLRQENFHLQTKLQTSNATRKNEEILQQQLTQMKQYAKTVEGQNDSLGEALKKIKYVMKEKDENIQSLTKEKDELQIRLSTMAGNQLTKGNANITDLSDPNRPMKIGDQFVELYDNEWTDAIECTQSVMSLFPDLKSGQIEEIVIRHLYKIITVCYKECLLISQEHLANIDKAVNDMLITLYHEGKNSLEVSTLSGLKELMEMRRQNGEQFADYLCRKNVLVNRMHLADWPYDQKNEDLTKLLLETPFFDKCVHLCWYMVIQDPMMYLDDEAIPDIKFDKNLYREYTCSGDKVKFGVWPALFLHKDGPVLCKGVVQVYSQSAIIV